MHDRRSMGMDVSALFLWVRLRRWRGLGTAIPSRVRPNFSNSRNASVRRMTSLQGVKRQWAAATSGIRTQSFQPPADVSESPPRLSDDIDVVRQSTLNVQVEDPVVWISKVG